VTNGLNGLSVLSFEKLSMARTYFFSLNARVPSSNSPSAVRSALGAELNQGIDGADGSEFEDQPAAVMTARPSAVWEKYFLHFTSVSITT
jgi:hypothetical protein